MSEFCDECGTELIDKCFRCGAPVCCPKCCREDNGINRKQNDPCIVCGINDQAEGSKYCKGCITANEQATERK